MRIKPTKSAQLRAAKHKNGNLLSIIANLESLTNILANNYYILCKELDDKGELKDKHKVWFDNCNEYDGNGSPKFPEKIEPKESKALEQKGLSLVE